MGGGSGGSAAGAGEALAAEAGEQLQAWLAARRLSSMPQGVRARRGDAVISSASESLGRLVSSSMSVREQLRLLLARDVRRGEEGSSSIFSSSVLRRTGGAQCSQCPVHEGSSGEVRHTKHLECRPVRLISSLQT